MKIQILVDNQKSWILFYANRLASILKEIGHSVFLLHDHNSVTEGDILILLSCEKIFKYLHLNTHNLVVHESNLPRGKGWSPLSWQIIEGENRIMVTLFEASEKVDNGNIYFQQEIQLNGSELIDELRVLQGNATIDLITKFITEYPNVKGATQKGKETFYPRRTASDSELNIDLTINQQFNLLRIVDNERYPAFFYKNGVKYIIKIYKSN